MAELTAEQEKWIKKIERSADDYLITTVPKKHLTPDFYLEAIRVYGPSICQVPVEFITPEMCLLAVERRSFRYIPKELLTKEIALALVQRWAEDINLIPQEMITPELCLAAVQKSGAALASIPEAFKTFDICTAALERTEDEVLGDWDIDIAFKYVPESLKEQVRNAVDESRQGRLLGKVKKFGANIKYVADEYITPELCRVAVEQYAGALEYVPKDLRTAELCLMAVQQRGNMLKHVPENLKTLEICVSALKADPDSAEYFLAYVPETLKDQVKKAAGIK
jgi:hypothetical protein